MRDVKTFRKQFTVSLDLTTVPTWGAISVSLRELRSYGDSSEDFVYQQVERLDAMRLELEERERELDERQQALRESEEEIARQSERLDELRRSTNQGAQRVQQEARRLARLQAELAAAKAALDSGANSAANTVGASESQGDRSQEIESLQAELAAARTQIARLADASLELAGARKELAKARADLLRKGLRLAHAKQGMGSDSREKIEELLNERAQLLGSLEQTKAGATTAIAEAKQQADADRAVWLEELRRLREAIERGQTVNAAAGSQEFGHVASATSLGLTGADPILENVIAQFEQIQKDLGSPLEATQTKKPSKRASGSRRGDSPTPAQA